LTTCGIVLIIVWAVLRFKPMRFKPIKLTNPQNLESLQSNAISALESIQSNLLSTVRGSSIKTALLTAGLLSIALSF